MALIDDAKKELRISNTAHDTEVTDLIASAKKDLEFTAIDASKIVESDPLIKRAIILYCKANFGYDNPDAPRFQASYDALKITLANCGDYDAVV